MDHSELTSSILGAAFDVSNELGSGFLEKVYENAILIRLHELGIEAKSQQLIEIYFHNKKVGHYFADVLINDSVIIELKATQELTSIHQAQIINYLKASNIPIGLLINFGNPKLEYRRFNNRSQKNLSP